MAFALGDPRYDPHGAPIPTREGEIEQGAFVALDEVEVGARVVLRQVSDDDSERLRYLAALGLVPAAEMTVLEKQPFGGPIRLRVGTTETRDRQIGPELAASLLVERR
jgi:DtxR family Mn-dependent transcriptional regulator